jgi:hypothetical protein
MNKRSVPRADLQTTWQRLLARHQSIERQLELALRRAGLSRAALRRSAERGGRLDAGRLEAARRWIETQSQPVAELSYEELSRPSLEQISRRHPGRLISV